MEYLPLIYDVLGEIDLDPCSTHDANQQFLQAKKIYTLADDGLNMEEPWKGKTYLFPPLTVDALSVKSEAHGGGVQGGSHGSTPSVIWFRRLLREWKLRNIPEAIFYTVYPEMLRICPEMWDFPVCFPKDRARLDSRWKVLHSKTTDVLGIFCVLAENGVRF